ncbi:MAG: hypothetical protein M3Q07_17770 [Pseudobdellovibrionaceae bacterium]|nr:hypothetical protein [Pseudobdellovibrionaceae bacterium]
MSEPNIIRKPANPDVNYSEIELIHREVRLRADTLMARVIRLDGSEGMLSTHLSELLNISESGLRKHIRSRAIGAQSVVAHRMRSELGADVIPIFARSVLFLPKESVQELVKVIDTLEAWAVYRQLWEYAEKFAELESERDQLLAQCRLLEAERCAIAEKAEELARKSLETSNLLKEMKLQLQETKARLGATVEFIERGGKAGKKYRHSVVEIEFAGVNIFEGPQYRANVKKLPIEDMNPKERNTHAVQKAAVTAYGIAKSVKKRLGGMSAMNPAICEKRITFVMPEETLWKQFFPVRIQSLD